MKYYRFPENKTWKVIFGVFLFVMLYITRTTMTTSDLIGTNRAQFMQLGLMGLMGIAFLVYNRKSWKQILTDARIAALIVITVIMLLPMVIKRDWQMMYLSVLLCLYFAVFLSYFYSFQEVARYYVLILSALAVYSLIATYVLKPLVDAGVLHMTKLNYANWVDYYHFGFANVIDLENYWRNYSIFREPGLYQFYLYVALFLNNYSIEWKNPRTVWAVNALLIVTLVTTMSTVGLIVLALFVALVFVDRKLYKQKKMWILALSCAAMMGLVFAVIAIKGGNAYERVLAIVTKLFTNSRSYSHRMEAIIADVRLILQHPLMGARFSDVLFAAEDNTASTLILYAVYGIVGGTLNVLAWAALVWKKDRKVWLNCGFVLACLLDINTQNMVAEPFFWLFPTMALVERGMPLLKQLRKKA